LHKIKVIVELSDIGFAETPVVLYNLLHQPLPLLANHKANLCFVKKKGSRLKTQQGTEGSVINYNDNDENARHKRNKWGEKIDQTKYHVIRPTMMTAFSCG
jgi:hypothetical protein